MSDVKSNKTEALEDRRFRKARSRRGWGCDEGDDGFEFLDSNLYYTWYIFRDGDQVEYKDSTGKICCGKVSVVDVRTTASDLGHLLEGLESHAFIELNCKKVRVLQGPPVRLARPLNWKSSKKTSSEVVPNKKAELEKKQHEDRQQVEILARAKEMFTNTELVALEEILPSYLRSLIK